MKQNHKDRPNPGSTNIRNCINHMVCHASTSLPGLMNREQLKRIFTSHKLSLPTLFTRFHQVLLLKISDLHFFKNSSSKANSYCNHKNRTDYRTSEDNIIVLDDSIKALGVSSIFIEIAVRQPCIAKVIIQACWTNEIFINSHTRSPVWWLAFATYMVMWNRMWGFFNRGFENIFIINFVSRELFLDYAHNQVGDSPWRLLSFGSI